MSAPTRSKGQFLCLSNPKLFHTSMPCSRPSPGADTRKTSVRPSMKPCECTLPRKKQAINVATRKPEPQPFESQTRGLNPKKPPRVRTPNHQGPYESRPVK